MKLATNYARASRSSLDAELGDGLLLVSIMVSRETICIDTVGPHKNVTHSAFIHMLKDASLPAGWTCSYCGGQSIDAACADYVAAIALKVADSPTCQCSSASAIVNLMRRKLSRKC
jgi:hypothetical protein